MSRSASCIETNDLVDTRGTALLGVGRVNEVRSAARRSGVGTSCRRASGIEKARASYGEFVEEAAAWCCRTCWVTWGGSVALGCGAVALGCDADLHGLVGAGEP